MTVCTRFAPSPTGSLHIGGVRTALYSWLYARQKKGKFLLRIEDTDRQRSTDAATQTILEGMAWLGLYADENPIYQTQRFDRYHEVLTEMLANGTAYRCTCSKERLDNLREEQLKQKQKIGYDGHCRAKNITTDSQEPFVIRFKNPTEGQVIIDDLILGRVIIDNAMLDDLVLARADGTPTYNFTVVVDDRDMAITHVIRGNDHLNNTSKQINLFRALDATPPFYAHLPMIMGSDGQKMSKRHGAVSVMDYRNEGFLPQALLNYLARLGWSHGDQEIFSIEEMIEYFDICKVSKSAAVFDQDKLLWLNQQYIINQPVEVIVPHLKWHLLHQGYDLEVGPAIEDVLLLLRERCSTLKEMSEKARFCYQEPSYDLNDYAKFLMEGLDGYMNQLKQKLEQLELWQTDKIQEIIKDVITSNQLKFPQLAQPVRIAITGSTSSPAVNEVLATIGQKKALARLSIFLDKYTQNLSKC